MDAVTNVSELKQREHGTWTGVAPGWRKHDERFVKSAAPVTERMLDVLALDPGMTLLDIACGTGEPAIPAAERVRRTHRRGMLGAAGEEPVQDSVFAPSKPWT